MVLKNETTGSDSFVLSGIIWPPIVNCWSMIRCLSICVTNYELFITFLSNWPILFIVDSFSFAYACSSFNLSHTSKSLYKAGCMCVLVGWAARENRSEWKNVLLMWSPKITVKPRTWCVEYKTTWHFQYKAAAVESDISACSKLHATVALHVVFVKLWSFLNLSSFFLSVCLSFLSFFVL